jgi:hypothetical protein
MLQGSSPSIRFEDPADHIEEGAFPAPIRTDQADELPAGQVYRDAVHRAEASEVLSHLLEAEDRGHPLSPAGDLHRVVV